MVEAAVYKCFFLPSADLTHDVWNQSAWALLFWIFCLSGSISAVGFAGRICWCFFSPSVLISNVCTCAHVFMWTCRMLRQSFANVISGAPPLHSFSTTDLQLPRLYLASVVFPLQLLIKIGVCVSWTRHSLDSSSDAIPRPISSLQAVWNPG